MRTGVQLKLAKFAIARNRPEARSAVKSCESSVATSTPGAVIVADNGPGEVRGSSDFISISMGNHRRAASEKGNSLLKQNRPRALILSSASRFSKDQERSEKRKRKETSKRTRERERGRELDSGKSNVGPASRCAPRPPSGWRRRINRKVHESACTKYAPR